MFSNLTFSTYIILIFNISITCMKDDQGNLSNIMKGIGYSTFYCE